MFSTARSAIPATVHTPRFHGSGRIELTEVSLPEPGPGEVLLRVRANAACGSDRPLFHSGATVTPGHEVVGDIAATGPGVTLAIGAQVVVFLMDFCGRCRSCRVGATNQCLNKRADVGFTVDGGYGPYVLTHASNVFPTGGGLSPAEATLLLDVMGTGGHALGRAQLVRPDCAALLVTGAGPIGLGVLAMAHLLYGPGIPVAITDVQPFRLDLARRLGGEPIDLRTETLDQGLGRIGLGEVDVAIDTTGKAVARRTALDKLGQRGVLVCVGHGEELRMEVSPDLIATERAVLGSEYFRYDEIAGNLDLLKLHRAYLGMIITHTYPVVRLHEALTFFHGGACGKVVVEQGAES